VCPLARDTSISASRRRGSARWVLFFSLLALRLFALPDYSSGILDLDAVKAAAASVDRARFPNADDVLIDDAIVSEYQADGTAVTVDDTCLKVLTEKGRRDHKVLSRRFTLPFSTATFDLVQVITPDGRVLPVDLAAQSRVMVDPSQMGSNIYNPDSKVLQVTIPELSVGDLVRYVARENLVKPRVPNTFSDYQVFEYTSPILRYTYEVNGPKVLPLRSIALKGEIPGTVRHTQREEGERVVHRWEVCDVPRMYSEPRMPPLHTVVQRLLVSTIPDWQYLSTWYDALCEPHMQTSAAMKAKVDELVKGLDAREARLRAVFRFVSQEIRYMGITVEKEAPGYEPHDVTLTFENRHGVCRDKAVLLVAMLRLADLKAYPVLIHNGPKKDVEVPQPFFNHAIAAAENADGSYALMDPTDENTKDLFPAYLCNQSYLVARPDGDTLRTSPIVPAEDNLVRIETAGRIDARGTLVGSSTLRLDGINDNAYRGYFSSIKPDERRLFFDGLVKQMAAGARLTALAIRPEDLRDTETPLEITLSFEAENVPVSDGTTRMLPLPRLGVSVGMANFILRDAGLKQRKYPFLTEFACGVREAFQLELDPALGTPVALPSYEPIASDTLAWELHLKAEGRTLSGEGTFLIRAVELTPDQYLDLKQALKRLEVYARKRPILQHGDTAATEADSIVLESIHEVDLQDASHWTTVEKVRRRILSYKGKKDHAELKWGYNPVWEKIEILRAAVTAADGTIKEISAQEINEMDAGWVASAPRYPAGKTLVASLPGVEIGCQIEYEVRHTVSGRPFFATRHAFRGFEPLQRKVLRIRSPAGLALRCGVFQGGTLAPDAEVAIEASSYTDEQGRVVREWLASDQPALRREDGLPPADMFLPTVMVSAGDWQDYTRALTAATKSAGESSAAVKALTRETVAGAKDAAEAVRAIRDLMATRIRRAGPALNDLPLSAISPAETTLRDGYGNTTDSAILLSALLRQAGFRPQLILGSGMAPIAASEDALMGFPATSLFPEVLVAAKVPGIGLVYLNDTDQYASLGATAHDGRLGLRLDGGRTVRIAASAGRRDADEYTYGIRLDAEGHAEVSFCRTTKGGHFGAQNRSFSEMPPEERRRYYEEAVAGLSQNAEATSDLLTDFAGYPGTERFTARVAHLGVRDGDFLYLTLPRTLHNLLGLRSDQRTHPLFWGSPRRLRIVTELALPPEFSEAVLLPAEFFWNGPAEAGCVYVGVRRPEAAVVQVIHEVDLNPAVLPAAAYADLLETNRRLSHPGARTVLLRRVPAQP
jgi:transglutaminase-like putative cysteine protease